MNTKHIPKEPEKEYRPQAAKGVLACARTYLANADRLVYSYGSKTFLSGYEICDPGQDHRGNIDCSTFVILVLSGIPYEKSPYATGTVKGLVLGDVMDFSSIPDRYISIAERIGRPYLAGPKGLDLTKAEQLGISVQTLEQEIRASGIVRRSVYLAEYCLNKNACFLDARFRMPGDLVFFRSSGFFTDREKKYQGRAEINHVGILSEDPDIMINSSGYYGKAAGKDGNLPAVSLVPVFGKREPAFFARI